MFVSPKSAEQATLVVRVVFFSEAFSLPMMGEPCKLHLIQQMQRNHLERTRKMKQTRGNLRNNSSNTTTTTNNNNTNKQETQKGRHKTERDVETLWCTNYFEIVPET